MGITSSYRKGQLEVSTKTEDKHLTISVPGCVTQLDLNEVKYLNALIEVYLENLQKHGQVNTGEKETESGSCFGEMFDEATNEFSELFKPLRTKRSIDIR